MSTVYSDPRLELVIEDYPLGGTKRGQCRFYVDKNPKRGARVGKVTTGKPSFTTFANRAAIVTGDDGRTYVLRDVKDYGFVDVSRSDFKTHESVHKSSSPERYATLMALIDAANA